jgi:uncharacterized protein YeaO (DUF488 family)
MSNSETRTETGTIGETYHAAIEHDLVSLSGDEHLIGVARQPTSWFRSTVDENYSELGPPEELLDEFKNRHEDLKTQGMCDDGAHNAAWEELGFEERYQEHLETSEDVAGAVDELVSRIRSGEDIVLVCFEDENKRCHRHELVSVIEDRIGQ